MSLIVFPLFPGWRVPDWSMAGDWELEMSTALALVHHDRHALRPGEDPHRPWRNLRGAFDGPEGMHLGLFPTRRFPFPG